MDLTVEAIRLGMNMAQLRAEVASTNIANVHVAGYRAERADFGAAMGLLREAAADPDMAVDRLTELTPAVLRSSVNRADGEADSSASLDGQVAELESAGVDFQSLTTVLSRRFALMQLALTGRNG
ncbi:flagellar basal body rod protein FlgB [Rhodanobacter sp. UC4437_H4]|jgi:flagellar basal body rod protein FlgB